MGVASRQSDGGGEGYVERRGGGGEEVIASKDGGDIDTPIGRRRGWFKVSARKDGGDIDTSIGRRRGWFKKKPWEPLVKYTALPDDMKDNEFILKYYRANLSIRQTFLSVFTIHNETLNIWTHLLGFFLFVGLTVYTVRKLPWVAETNFSRSLGWQSIKGDLSNFMDPSSQNPITRWPFFIFLSGAMFCLLTSSLCHLLLSHSKLLANIMVRLDYAGIASLIAASFYPPVYYSFMCYPRLRSVYLTSITAIGVATILVSLIPAFQSVEYRSFRAALFFGMGISGVIPCVHKLLLYWDEPIAVTTFFLEIAMGSLYGLGALIFATRVPERWNPGRFDIAGSSHQYFHILVVAGALTHYRAGLLYLSWRDVQGCP